MKCTRLIQFVLVGVLSTFASAADLEEGFRNPSEETKPWCYWYWLNGDIAEEGLTKDLEAMARVGIRRAMIGNIEGGGAVKMFSPQWYALTRHALKEANRLSVDLKKMPPIMISLARQDEWSALLSEIREKYRKRPRFIEIPERLEGRTILQTQRARRRRR